MTDVLSAEELLKLVPADVLLSAARDRLGSRVDAARDALRSAIGAVDSSDINYRWPNDTMIAHARLHARQLTAAADCLEQTIATLASLAAPEEPVPAESSHVCASPITET